MIDLSVADHARGLAILFWDALFFTLGYLCARWHSRRK